VPPRNRKIGDQKIGDRKIGNRKIGDSKNRRFEKSAIEKPAIEKPKSKTGDRKSKIAGVPPKIENRKIENLREPAVRCTPEKSKICVISQANPPKL
jgi:hypothetical protein